MTNLNGSYARPGALDKKDLPIDSYIYYRPFLYGTPTRWGMMGKSFGLGVTNRKKWIVRWLKNIFGKN